MNFSRLIKIILITSLSIYFKESFTALAENVNENDKLKALTKVVVPIESLPEPFSNDHLPSEQSVSINDQCYDLLGCFKPIPNWNRSEDPLKTKTKFRIVRNNNNNQSDIIVPFEHSKNCFFNGQYQCDIYPFNLATLLKSGFNPNQRTIIVFGGYLASEWCKWMVEIKEKWLQLDERANVVLVDWSGGNRALYNVAIANMRVVARQTTVLLYYLAKLNGFELDDESFTEKIYLIGHSLGAHMSGFIGKEFAGKIGRITGLDPAGPVFDNLTSEFKLNRNDAKLVDVLHTNGGPKTTFSNIYFGTQDQLGHLDFYANNGKHQPNCDLRDEDGCSHKMASKFYIDILTHEILIRKYLGKNYNIMYRLQANRATTFEDFHNGSSLLKLCPKTMDDADDGVNIFQDDINNCMIPIDYFNWFDQYRNELENEYNLNFQDVSNNNNRMFFYTNLRIPYLNNHYLIKIRSSSISSEQSDPTFSQCDLTFNLLMANGQMFKHKVKQYHDVINNNHYQEVVLPFLGEEDTYELEGLDSNDFYLNLTDRKELLKSIRVIMPISIEIIGLERDSSEYQLKTNNNLSTTWMNFLNMANDDDNNDVKNKINHHNDCKLIDIDRVSIKPLKKLHRYFSAFYSIKAANKRGKPDLIVLNGGEEQFPKVEIDVSHKEKQQQQQAVKGKFVIFLDTVILGPHESVEIGLIEDIDTQEAADNISTSISASTWLILTILTIFLMILLSSISLYFMLKGSTNTNSDTNRLVGR